MRSFVERRWSDFYECSVIPRAYAFAARRPTRVRREDGIVKYRIGPLVGYVETGHPDRWAWRFIPSGDRMDLNLTSHRDSRGQRTVEFTWWVGRSSSMGPDFHGRMCYAGKAGRPLT